MNSCTTLTLHILLYGVMSGCSQRLTEKDVSDQSRDGCGDFQCGDISYDEILKWYRGLLLTEEEITDLKIKREEEREINLQAQGYEASIKAGDIGDGDACCATKIVLMWNETMINLDGVKRSIVHMSDTKPAKYQYIPHGSCVEYGDCTGTCVVEPTLLTLLIVDGDSLAFDFFQVPGYCSCKNFHL